MAEPPQTPGSTIYTPFFLNLYDLLVLGLSNLFLWKCPTSTILLPLFEMSLRKRHLDIGVGTGYFPSKALTSTSTCRELTLLDINPVALDTSRRRILQSISHDKLTINSVLADATLPLPLEKDQEFDSISMFYLLHCLSGPADSKNKVFDLVSAHLTAQGVCVGATILPLQEKMSRVAACVMRYYNKRGIFDNANDSESIFREGLERNFTHVDVWTVGTVMCWRAQGRKSSPRNASFLP